MTSATSAGRAATSAATTARPRVLRGHLLVLRQPGPGAVQAAHGPPGLLLGLLPDGQAGLRIGGRDGGTAGGPPWVPRSEPWTSLRRRDDPGDALPPRDPTRLPVAGSARRGVSGALRRRTVDWQSTKRSRGPPDAFFGHELSSPRRRIRSRRGRTRAWGGILSDSQTTDELPGQWTWVSGPSRRLRIRRIYSRRGSGADVMPGSLTPRGGGRSLTSRARQSRPSLSTRTRRTGRPCRPAHAQNRNVSPAR